jgi:hypothetical protein
LFLYWLAQLRDYVMEWLGRHSRNCILHIGSASAVTHVLILTAESVVGARLVVLGFDQLVWQFMGLGWGLIRYVEVLVGGWVEGGDWVLDLVYVLLGQWFQVS